jgi:hypothetical protein
MSVGPMIDTDEHGFVTLEAFDGSYLRSPLYDRVPADIPDGRNRAERRRAARLRRTARKDLSRAAVLLRELEVHEVRQALDQAVAEGKIQKVGHDLYQALPRQPTLADRLAERRDRALGRVAGEGEQS